ncbi:MAG: T9SS type A sorting domain-containing protein [Crocinitomicaceae bacterium]
MKKLVLILTIFLVGSTLYSQNKFKPYNFGRLEEKVNTQPTTVDYRPTPKSGDRALNILWTENFDGTMADTTSNGVWTKTGNEGTYWNMSTSNIAPNGYLLSMDGRHLLWDSRTPLGSNEPGGFATTALEGSAISPTIDLTGYTDAILEFNLNAMFCCFEEPWSFAISNDNGATWGLEIPLDLGLSANDNSNDIAEPVKFSTNITSFLDPLGANNSDVKIRFTWVADSTSSAGQYSSHYYWTIDDIVIYEIPDYEVSQNKLWLQDLSQGFEYTNMPANLASTLTVQAPISNNGLNTPTNLAMEVTVFDAGTNAIIFGPVSGGNLSNPPFLAGNDDTITFATAFDMSMLAIGEYKVRSVITYDEIDEIQANDSLIRTFRISSESLGHVNYDANPVTNINNFSNDDTKRGALFTVKQISDFCGVSFYLENGSGIPTTVDVPIVISIDDRTNDIPVAHYGYELKANMLGGWYMFNFFYSEPADSDGQVPPVLEPGIEYAITIKSYGNHYWYRANLGDEDRSSLLWFGGDGNWYWAGEEPWMLLNFSACFGSIDENIINPSIGISQNQPNPFNENTTISYHLNDAETVSVQIIDLAGKIVATYNEGLKGIGQHELTIGAGELSNGVYFYNFKAGNYSQTKKMVVRQ